MKLVKLGSERIRDGLCVDGIVRRAREDRFSEQWDDLLISMVQH